MEWKDWLDLTKAVGTLITAAVAVGGAWWAVHRFFLESKEREALRRDQAQKDHKIQLRESQKPFLERQLEYYFDITKVVSQLSTLPKGQGFDDAKQRFWEFYWGELSIVEDRQVEDAMVNIGYALNALDVVLACDETGTSVLPSDKYPEIRKSLKKVHLEQILDSCKIHVNIQNDDPVDSIVLSCLYDKIRTELRNLTLKLAHEVRDSLKRGWGLRDTSTNHLIPPG
jgi:hypothetical protein